MTRPQPAVAVVRAFIRRRETRRQVPDDVYVQVEFFLNELARLEHYRPDLTDRPEYRAVFDQDHAAIESIGLERIATALLSVFSGMNPDAFRARVERFFRQERHPA